MNTPIKLLRRLGPDRVADALCVGCNNCPDILEMESGDFAVIGRDITETAKSQLAALSAGCGPNERVVLLPRNLLVNAKPYIPSHS